MKNYFILSTICLVILGCSKQPKIEGFNSELWKNDKKGCEGKRSYLSEILLSHSKELRGMDDDVVVEFLGKPEASDWEERNKKTYFYFIQTGKQCDPSFPLEGAKIAIEFDALGRVQLVTEKKF